MALGFFGDNLVDVLPNVGNARIINSISTLERLEMSLEVPDLLPEYCERERRQTAPSSLLAKRQPTIEVVL